MADKEIKIRLKKAKDTLNNVKKSKKTHWNISKESMINYCNETIILCKLILEKGEVT